MIYARTLQPKDPRSLIHPGLREHVAEGVTHPSNRRALSSDLLQSPAPAFRIFA